MNFIDKLKALDGEATKGLWQRRGKDLRVEYKNPPHFHHVIFGSTEANAELVCLLRNNTQAIIELVEAADAVVNNSHTFLGATNYVGVDHKYLHPLLEALSKIKGGV